MKSNPIPSYYFDFTFETNGSEAHLVDLEWISKKMGLRPSITRLKGEGISTFGQITEANFTRWSKQSKVYKDWNIDKNFENFVDKFYKKHKQILQILQAYPEILAFICYIPTFYDDRFYICQITPAIAKKLADIQTCFISDLQMILSKSRMKELLEENTLES